MLPFALVGGLEHLGRRDLSEQDVGQIKVGAPARVTFRAFPGETFEGPATFILHELDMATRTAKVRVAVQNQNQRIKHEIFADVEIDTGAGEPAPRRPSRRCSTAAQGAEGARAGRTCTLA